MTEAQVAANEINARTARWQTALDDIFKEALRSTVKHGDQHHVPSGTGDQVALMHGTELPKPFPHVPVTMGTFAYVARGVTDSHSFSEGDGTVTWADILLEEVAEAFAEDDPAKLREELVQSGAVILKWIEKLDRAEVMTAFVSSTQRSVTQGSGS